MRSFLLAILLFALMLTGIVVNTVCLRRFCSEMLSAIRAMPTLPADSSDAADRIAARWREVRPLISFSASDNMISRIDDAIAALCTHAAAGSTADYILAREHLRLVIEELRDYEMLTWENLL